MTKIQKFKHLISNYFRSWSDTKKINNIEGIPIIVNVHTPLKFRFYYRLIYILSLSGFNVCIYLASTKSFYNLARMDGGLDLLPPVKLINRIPKWLSSAVYCSDSQDQLWDRDWRKKIYLELDPVKPINDVIRPIFIPFSVHDYIHRCFWKEREGLLANPKNIRMLFSGAYHGYKGKDISNILGKLERQDIVEIYRDHPNTISITNQEQLEKVLAGPPTSRYYFVDQDHFRISGSQWLQVLSHVGVFLCPPGVTNVMSYNANEAIAMGAIPLINYPEWFHPHLQNHQNCFVFSEKDELFACLDEISGYSMQDLSIMKNNVLDYYDLYQSDEYILKKMKEFKDCRVISFVMNIEQEELFGIKPGSNAITSEHGFW